MTNINTFKIPTNVDNSLQFEDIPFETQGVNTEMPEGATLVEKKEVKHATTNYKSRKIGRIALFGINDKLAA